MLADGPSGGTVVVFTAGMADLLRQEQPEQLFEANHSCGSAANLKAVAAAKPGLPLVHAGDTYQGRHRLAKTEALHFGTASDCRNSICSKL